MNLHELNKHVSFLGILRTSLAVAVLALPVSGFAQQLDFGEDLWPIFEHRCIECHGPEEQKEGLRFDDLEWLSNEELLGDGDASQSLIYEKITLPPDDEERMPNKREPLSPEELDRIRRWLNDGAKADGWEVPDVIVVKRSGAESGEGDLLTELAQDVGPAPEDAVKALRDRGALVLPLARNNNLVQVDFNLADERIGDEDLALLQPLAEHVTWLGLANTGVTDAGLEILTGLPKLTRVHLGNTTVGDSGMAHIAKLKNLEYLNLINSAVGDAGLQELSSLSSLRKLFLWQSKVTAEGAKALEASNTGLDLNLGVGVVTDEEPGVDKADLSALFDVGSCCAQAHAKGETCVHDCCIEAAEKNEVCAKCNPGVVARLPAE